MKGLLVLATLVAPVNDGPQGAAEHLVALLAAGDAAPWQVAVEPSLAPERRGLALSLPGRLQGQAPALGEPWPVNKDRAVVPATFGAASQDTPAGDGVAEAGAADGAPVAGTPLHLCLAERDGAWHLAELFMDAGLAREWLYEHGKVGAAPSPAHTVGAFLVALRNGDAEAAERTCTHPCWDGPGDENARTIFEAALKASLEFKAETVETSEERAFARLNVWVGRQPMEDIDFYLVERPEGWLIAGFGRDPERAARYLSGTVGARPWPSTPDAAVEHVARALRDRLPHRLTAVCAPAVRAEGAPLEQLRARLARPGAALGHSAPEPVQEGRSLARLGVRGSDGSTEALWLLLEGTPDGWRVRSAIADQAEARAFHEGPRAR